MLKLKLQKLENFFMNTKNINVIRTTIDNVVTDIEFETMSEKEALKIIHKDRRPFKALMALNFLYRKKGEQLQKPPFAPYKHIKVPTMVKAFNMCSVY